MRANKTQRPKRPTNSRHAAQPAPLLRIRPGLQFLGYGLVCQDPWCLLGIRLSVCADDEQGTKVEIGVVLAAGTLVRTGTTGNASLAQWGGRHKQTLG